MSKAALQVGVSYERGSRVPCRDWSEGFRPSGRCSPGLRSRVQVLGLRVQGLGFGVQGFGFKAYVSGFRVDGLGFRVLSGGFRVEG